MKKIFLLFGIAAFSAASAQEKDVFDIQQYLQKKLADTKKNDDKLKLVFPFNNPYSAPAASPVGERSETYTLPNGDQVVSLSVDNMPCVRPDMSKFRAMPNLAYNESFNYAPLKAYPGQLPNGSLPYLVIPDK